MKTLKMLSLLLALIALALPASAAHGACWTKTSMQPFSHFDAPPDYQCFTVFGSLVAQSHAYARADGPTCAGDAYAWDCSTACEAKGMVAVAVGYDLTTWTDRCEIGDAEYSFHTEIEGFVDLRDADCAGAALGYVEIKSNLLSAPLLVQLHKSAGETQSGALGQIQLALAGFTGTLPIVVQTGIQIWPDFDAIGAAGHKCINIVTLEFRSRAWLQAWANSGLTDIWAEVIAQLEGTSNVSLQMGTCPHQD